MEVQLIEPEVWIEYCWIYNGVFVGDGSAVFIIPAGVIVRSTEDMDTGTIVWEYLA